MNTTAGPPTWRARASNRRDNRRVPQVHAVEIADRYRPAPEPVGNRGGIADEFHGGAGHLEVGSGQEAGGSR